MPVLIPAQVAALVIAVATTPVLIAPILIAPILALIALTAAVKTVLCVPVPMARVCEG
jgi:hypothetical protein